MRVGLRVQAELGECDISFLQGALLPLDPRAIGSQRRGLLAAAGRRDLRAVPPAAVGPPGRAPAAARPDAGACRFQ